MARPHRPRPARSVGRRSPVQNTFSGDIILVVCEGSVTEPTYFKALRDQWKLHSAQVVVCGEECGNDPLSVVEYALDRKQGRKKEKKRGQLPYDQVWCVIDSDVHPKLNAARELARSKGIKLALSIPCFEFWFLLHFVYTTRQFENCEAVKRELRSQLPGGNYDKSNPPLQELIERTDEACTNATRVLVNRKGADTDDPSTKVHLLVEELQSIKHTS